MRLHVCFEACMRKAFTCLSVYYISGEILGFRVTQDTPVRNPEEKSYLPYRIYPKPTFPEYVSGFSYVIKGDT